jgi:hypothetical protein
MKLKDQSCIQCRYWREADDSTIGQCKAPLPVSLSGWLVKLKPTFSTDGWDCKSYRKRIQRRKTSGIKSILCSQCGADRLKEGCKMPTDCMFVGTVTPINQKVQP